MKEFYNKNRVKMKLVVMAFYILALPSLVPDWPLFKIEYISEGSGQWYPLRSHSVDNVAVYKSYGVLWLAIIGLLFIEAIFRKPLKLD